MSPRRLLVLPLIAAAIALAAACGGGGEEASTEPSNDVPENAIAVVAGTPILRTQFDRLFEQTEAAYESRQEEFPQAGTPQYEQLKNEAVEFLVRRVEFAKEADVLGIEVTAADVDQRLADLKEQFFQGDQQTYEAELEKAKLTEAEVKENIRAQLISERIFEEVTKGETVPAGEVETYYSENEEQFTTPESRDVAHILVETKKQADDIYAQLQDGGDFAALAKEHSTDTGSKDNGGKYTDVRGSFVAEFEEVAFSIETGEIAEPVKSQFGWHIITALADTQPESVKPLSEVEEQIRDQLLTEKRNETMTAWVEQVEAKYADEIDYAIGFSPAPDTSTTPPAATATDTAPATPPADTAPATPPADTAPATTEADTATVTSTTDE